MDGYPGNKHKAFRKLEEARAYMQKNGVTVSMLIGSEPASTRSARDQPHYYAVANGSQPGVYDIY